MSNEASPFQLDRRIAIGTALALTVGNFFLHLPISEFCDWLFRTVGRRPYELISVTAIGGMSVAAAIPAAKQVRTASPNTWLPFALAGLAFLTLASQRWLLVSNIELVHFPQFALLAVLFLFAGFGAKLAWLLAALAGFADESYQHFVLYRDTPNTYFDINDIVLNTVGAAWGACVFGATKLAAEGRWLTADAAKAIAALAVSAIVLALAIDPPAETFLSKAMTGRWYRTLSAGEGLAAVVAVAFLVELASWRRRESDR